MIRKPDAPYAKKLGDWFAKEQQKAELTKEQKALQGEIAQDMGLTVGERRNVTADDVGYVVIGTSSFNDQGQEVMSCSINAAAIDEALTTPGPQPLPAAES